MLTRFSLVALLTALSALTTAAAQDFPAKTAKIIVPFLAGGPNDVVGRLLAHHLGEELKGSGSFIVENMAGAGGRRGLSVVAKADPDGYTLGITANAPMAIQPNLYSSLPYDPVKSFVHLAVVASGTVVVAVHPGVPAKTVKELIAHAKANPDKLVFGSPGVGSIPHLQAERFQAAAGVKLRHVPYSGGATVARDLVGGHIHLTFDAPLVSAEAHKAGTVRVLAVMDTRRNPVMPDVPTIAEAGLGGIEIEWWIGLLGPAGMPRPLVDRITSTIEKILQRPDIRTQLANQDMRPNYMPPERFTQTIVEETKTWAKVIAAAGVKVTEEKQ